MQKVKPEKKPEKKPAALDTKTIFPKLLHMFKNGTVPRPKKSTRKLKKKQ